MIIYQGGYFGANHDISWGVPNFRFKAHVCGSVGGCVSEAVGVGEIVTTCCCEYHTTYYYYYYYYINHGKTQ